MQAVKLRLVRSHSLAILAHQCHPGGLSGASAGALRLKGYIQTLNQTYRVTSKPLQFVTASYT